MCLLDLFENEQMVYIFWKIFWIERLIIELLKDSTIYSILVWFQSIS